MNRLHCCLYMGPTSSLSNSDNWIPLSSSSTQIYQCSVARACHGYWFGKFCHFGEEGINAAQDNKVTLNWVNADSPLHFAQWVCRGWSPTPQHQQRQLYLFATSSLLKLNSQHSTWVGLLGWLTGGMQEGRLAFVASWRPLAAHNAGYSIQHSWHSVFSDGSVRQALHLHADYFI